MLQKVAHPPWRSEAAMLAVEDAPGARHGGRVIDAMSATPIESSPAASGFGRRAGPRPVDSAPGSRSGSVMTWPACGSGRLHRRHVSGMVHARHRGHVVVLRRGRPSRGPASWKRWANRRVIYGQQTAKARAGTGWFSAAFFSRTHHTPATCQRACGRACGSGRPSRRYRG